MFFCLGWFFLNSDKVLKTAIWSLNMAFLISEDMTTGIATFLKIMFTRRGKKVAR